MWDTKIFQDLVRSRYQRQKVIFVIAFLPVAVVAATAEPWWSRRDLFFSVPAETNDPFYPISGRRHPDHPRSLISTSEGRNSLLEDSST